MHLERLVVSALSAQQTAVAEEGREVLGPARLHRLELFRSPAPLSIGLEVDRPAEAPPQALDLAGVAALTALREVALDRLEHQDAHGRQEAGEEDADQSAPQRDGRSGRQLEPAGEQLGVLAAEIGDRDGDGEREEHSGQRLQSHSVKCPRAAPAPPSPGNRYSTAPTERPANGARGSRCRTRRRRRTRRPRDDGSPRRSPSAARSRRP